MIYQSFWFGWSWIGLGGGIVLLILLFVTDMLRNKECSRWKDPVWLAWLAVPVYLIHQFEEYALHITNGQYDIVSTFYAESSPFAGFMDSMELPLAHFPLMNITFVWIALPIAAIIAKRNPVIGLSAYGFIILNGIVHLAGVAFMDMPPLENPGFFTGTFVFFPLTIWIIYACIKSGNLSGKGIVIALISGFIGHIALGSCYFFAIAGLPLGTLIADIVVGFTPIIMAWLLCKIFRVKFS